MSSTYPWLRFIVFVCLVTTIQCVALRNPSFWTNSASTRNPSSWANSASTPPKALASTSHKDGKKNFKGRNTKLSVNFQKLRNNFQSAKKTQTVSHNEKQFYVFNEEFQWENSFKCSPCICKNSSSNLVAVLCQGVEFTSYIPQNWPAEINAVIIDNGFGIEALDSRSFLIYTSLTYVKISTNNLVKVLSSNSVNSTSTVIELDLSRSLISVIEESSFLVFSNLLTLSLRFNLLRNVTKQMFTGLCSSRSLSVSYNVINFIANDTFDDLGNMISLDISHNRLLYAGHDLLPVRMFIPLNNLEHLYIDNICASGTYLCGTYPNKALQVLKKLKLLGIDGVDRRGLGPEINNLKYLKTLIISYPETDNFTDESYFDNVPFITTLTISMNRPQINPKAFSKLKHLVNLTQSPFASHGNNICQVLGEIQYLLNCSLQYLTLRNINDRGCGCKELRSQDAKYLTLLKLVELDLSGNYLAYLSPYFIALLPDSLKKIDLSGNGLSYEIFYSFDKFPKGLLELNLNNQYNVYHPCHDDINERHMTTLLNEAHVKHIKNKSLTSTLAESKISSKPQNLGHEIKNLNIEANEFSKDYLPPELRILRGDNFKNFGKTISDFYYVLSNYSLRELSLAGGEFKTWASLSLMPEIEIADFSNNYADYFNPIFFQENSSLKYLTFSNNLLGTAFQFDTDRLFFANVKQLVALDMSRNFITELANDYLKNLLKLQILDISKNKLQMINISFAHTTEIKFLDFSTNSITSISKQSRDDLDSIATNHRVYLDLTSNPLPCTCEGLELMKWMTLTNVFLLNQDFLVCRNEFNQVQEIGDLVQSVETLQRQCASKTIIILTCVFSFVVFGILLLTTLMYRYRWKLRYLRSIALVKLVGSRPTANNIGYRFDAYILYTNDTRRFVVHDCVRELEETRGHRLCIEERDFLPGTYNLSNIVSGVQNSSKTVAIVTPEFYQGEYSEYGVKMALMEETFMHRSVLFLCMYEPTENKELSHDLLTVMKQNNYIEFPPRQEVADEMINEFWNQFSRAIGKHILEEL